MDNDPFFVSFPLDFFSWQGMWNFHLNFLGFVCLSAPRPPLWFTGFAFNDFLKQNEKLSFLFILLKSPVVALDFKLNAWQMKDVCWFLNSEFFWKIN